MNTRNQQDPLRKLFTQLPKEKLPESFRSTLMQQIRAEAARIKKRNERLSMAAIIGASVFMLGLGILGFLYTDITIPEIDLSIPAMKWPKIPSFTSVPLYLFIGILSLLLLFGDYQMRKAYRRRHKD